MAQTTDAISKQAYEQLVAENEFLRQELAQLKRLIFGRKSEKFIALPPEQLGLGLDAEERPVAPQQEEITYKRRKPGKDKSKPVRIPIPDHLPRQTEIIQPDPVPEGAKQIGTSVTEILEMTPAKLFVRRIERPRYILPETEAIITAGLPTLPIPKGNAGPGLLAHLVISKYIDHLPFYRQVQMFKREQVSIAESTISGWFAATCNLLEPLYQVLKARLLKSDYLMADETPIPVQTSHKKGATHTGYHWVYHDPVSKLVCFDYCQSRAREGPQAFLENFTGALQTDGYTAYEKLEQTGRITLLACMAHARRKFEQALDNDRDRASQALTLVQALYATERTAREQGLDAGQRQQLRKEQATEKLDELEAWLKAQLPDVLPKSSIGKAITYTLNLWPRLKRYLDDGRYEIDNNLVENSIRPVALGRKNYLFAGSHEGAKRAAMIYSLLGTARKNDIEPFAWLEQVLSVIPDHPVNRLEELLPVKKSDQN